MNGFVKSNSSIRKRLTIQLLCGAAILTICLVLIVRSFAQQLAEQSQDNILAASLTSILDSASIQQGEIAVDIPYSAFSMLSNLADDRVFYRIDLNDEFLTGYADLPRPNLAANSNAPVFVTGPYRGFDIRSVAATRKLALGEQPIEVRAIIAQSRNGMQETLSEISRRVILFGSGFFVLSAIIALLAAQSTVGPLTRLAASVSRRGPQDLRPVIARVPEEMAPLVQSLNQFIGRLETSLNRSEDLITEAAHRVRTPLATVRAQAEITLRRVDKDENRQSLREMIRAIDNSSRAAGQLLDHAMVTLRTDHLERHEIDLNGLVRESVARMQAVANLKDITVIFENTAPSPIQGDIILIQNAIQNLLDNAIKYSPPDSRVEVQLERKDTVVTLTFRDQGRGLPSSDAERLTQRFVRGDNVAGTVGSGLGLTIVEEVMRAHGGTLSFENNPDGVGACVSISFLLS